MAVTTVDVHSARNLIIKEHHSYLDVRTVEEHLKGHVPGAINVPFLFLNPLGKERNPEFLEQVSSAFNKDDLIVMGCASGARSFLASQTLLEAGFGNVKNMAGGYASWVENGFAVTTPSVETTSPPEREISVTTVDVYEAKELIHSDHRYLDCRTEEEFKKGHVHGAINIPYMFLTPEGRKKNPDFLEKISATYSKDDLIVVGCASGNRSFHACKDLLNAGFKNVKNVGGGYAEWVENGFRVNIPEIITSLEIKASSTT